MADYRRHEIVSGLFVIAAAFVFALFAFKVGNLDLLGLFRGPTVTCRTYFADVRTLTKDAPVKVGGQTVGRVTGVRMVERPLTEAQARRLAKLRRGGESGAVAAGMVRPVIEVTFELHGTGLKLSDAAAVELRQESPLAPHFLALDPGQWPDGKEPPPLLEAAAGGKVLLLRARQTTELSDVIAMASGPVEDIARILTKIDTRVLNKENLERLDGILASSRETVSSIRGLVKDVRDVLTEKGAVRDRVLSILAALEKAAGRLETRLDAIQKRAEDLLAGGEGLVAETSAVVRENRAEIAETLRRARRTMWHAEMALRKIAANPAVLVWGDDSPDLEAGEIDETWLRASGRAPIYEQRDESPEVR